MHAIELVQCCHKRKLPTLVLKLDVVKAFDTVNWSTLLSILRVRGFLELWCSWVHGTPGPWFPCKKGLRKGDPLSPYLFFLVADRLQVMVKRNGSTEHPFVPGAPYHSLVHRSHSSSFQRRGLMLLNASRTPLINSALPRPAHQLLQKCHGPYAPG